jgi:putative hydrolase of the HAD superfamily
MTLEKLQAVVFDLDGTLLDRRASFERFIRDQRERFAQPLQAVLPDIYVQTLIRLDRNGYAPRSELFAGLAAQFDLPAALADELLMDYRAGFPGACMLFPGVHETLAGLRASGLKLGLITNGSVSMQTRKLEHLSLSSSFDVVVISAAEGVSKPDPQIFHRALARLQADPARSVFVGDHPDVDVAGARAAGMRAVWRRDSTVPRLVEADATIEEVEDLLAVLGVVVLRRPRLDEEDELLRAHRATSPEVPSFLHHYQEGMSLRRYLEVLDEQERPTNLPPGQVPSTFLLAFTGRRIVGRVAIRHTLNDSLLRVGGHIGYVVVPEFRRRGHATAILRLALQVAGERLGIGRVLVTCDDDNVGSIRTIENNRGVLENTVRGPDGQPKRRYWIDVSRRRQEIPDM